VKSEKGFEVDKKAAILKGWCNRPFFLYFEEHK